MYMVTNYKLLLLLLKADADTRTDATIAGVAYITHPDTFADNYLTRLHDYTPTAVLITWVAYSCLLIDFKWLPSWTVCNGRLVCDLINEVIYRKPRVSAVGQQTYSE